MKKKLQGILIPLLAILVIGFLAYDLNERFVGPIKDKSEKINNQIKLIQSDKIVAQNVSNNLDKKKNELSIIENKIPSTPSLPEVLDQIDSLARSNLLKWETGTPAPQPVFDENMPTDLSAWSIGATFTGDYDKIYLFIEQLYSISRLVTIESFTLQREQGSFRLNISMRFYAEEIK
jgi:Tfp pilus assembly protein PilO